MLNIILLALVFVFPPSLVDRQEEILAIAEQKQEQFLEQCYKWQDHGRCDAVLAKARIRLVDDFIFPVRFAPHGTAHARWFSQRRITESFYNRFSTNDINDCSESPIIRTREQMYKLSHYNDYWRDYPYDFICADPDDLLASVVHELCHAFGREIGHMPGKEECQP